MPGEVLKKEQVIGISNLPTLPELATRLLQIVNDPDTSASQVAALISKDVGITSKVLRMANSAFYGIPRTITTVQNAVVLLGMKVVNSLVLSVSVGTSFPSKNLSTGLDRKAFWKHSLACAVSSKMLARKLKHKHFTDPEECFCAGLLHDIGRLVLDQYFNERFVAAIEIAREKKCTLNEAEQEEFGCSHSEVGNWLTSKWELPRDLRNAIIHHHTPSETEDSQQNALLVQLADALSHDTGYHSIQGEVYYARTHDMAEALGIPSEEIEPLEKLIPEEIEKLEASLSFEQVS